MWRREDVIKKLREDQGDAPLREYASRVGCTASFLSQIYNGKREPSEDLLNHLNLEREITITYREKRRWK